MNLVLERCPLVQGGTDWDGHGFTIHQPVSGAVAENQWLATLHKPNTWPVAGGTTCAVESERLLLTWYAGRLYWCQPSGYDALWTLSGTWYKSLASTPASGYAGSAVYSTSVVGAYAETTDLPEGTTEVWLEAYPQAANSGILEVTINTVGHEWVLAATTVDGVARRLANTGAVQFSGTIDSTAVTLEPYFGTVSQGAYLRHPESATPQWRQIATWAAGAPAGTKIRLTHVGGEQYSRIRALIAIDTTTASTPAANWSAASGISLNVAAFDPGAIVLLDAGMMATAAIGIETDAVENQIGMWPAWQGGDAVTNGVYDVITAQTIAFSGTAPHNNTAGENWLLNATTFAPASWPICGDCEAVAVHRRANLRWGAGATEAAVHDDDMLYTGAQVWGRAVMEFGDTLPAGLRLSRALGLGFAEYHFREYTWNGLTQLKAIPADQWADIVQVGDGASQGSTAGAGMALRGGGLMAWQHAGGWIEVAGQADAPNHKAGVVACGGLASLYRKAGDTITPPYLPLFRDLASRTGSNITVASGDRVEIVYVRGMHLANETDGLPLPTAGQVLDGVDRGDGTTGTYVQPDATYYLDSGPGYGDGSATTGSATIPGVGYVLTAAGTYGVAGTGSTPTYVAVVEADVRLNTTYGPSSSLTGTLEYYQTPSAGSNALAAVYNKLVADTGAGTVYTLTGGRIYPGMAPLDATLPYVTVNIVSHDDDAHRFGGLDIDAVVQIDVYEEAKKATTSGLSSAVTVADTLVSNYHGSAVTITGYSGGVMSCLSAGVPTADEDEVRVMSEWRVTATKN